MGFAPPSSVLPSGYRWLFDIALNRYSFMVFAAHEFGECSDAQLQQVMRAVAFNDNMASIDMSAFPAGCQLLEKAPVAIGTIPVKTYLDKVFDIRHDDIGYYMMMNVILIVVLRFINHQKK